MTLPSPNIDELKSQLQPILGFAYIASQTLLAMYRTSQVLIPILPVILSSIAFFSYFPFLIQHHAFFTTTIILSVSVIAGCFQYNSIKQDEARGQKIVDLEHEINALKKLSKRLQRSLKDSSETLDPHEAKSALRIPRPAFLSVFSNQAPSSNKRIRRTQ